MYTTNHLAKLDGYQSSNEVLTAIEDVAGEEFVENPDDPDTSTCHRIWADPTPAEMAAVTAKAWALADPGDDTLRWGIETLRRGN